MFRRSFAALYLTATLVVLPGCVGESESALIESAVVALEQKQHAVAIIHLKSALQKNPDSPEARLLLGRALALSGDPASAILELRKARELKAPEDRVAPELARAMLAVGEEAKLITQFSDLKLVGRASADLDTSLATAHLMARDAPKAGEALDRALQADPKFGAALTLRARMTAAEGNIDEALAILDGVLTREPADAAAGTLKGDILRFAKKDNPAALQAYRQVLTQNPKSIMAHSAAMSILMPESNKDAARQQFAAMQKEAPQHPETVFFEAQLAFSDQDYKKVRELADRLLRVAPNNTRVLELAGAAEYRRKAYPQAELMLSQAVKLAPGQLLSRHLLAQTYLRTGQPEKALQLIDSLLESGKADVTSLSLAGEAYLLLGDAKRAEAALQAAAKAAPDNSRVQTSAAVARLISGNNTASAIDTLEAIAAEDKSPRADLALVSAKLQAKDLPGAMKALDALQAKQPESPLAYQLRGRIQLMQRDSVGARASFETALGKDAQYFPAAASLSAMDLAAGQPDLARQRLEGLLKLNPANQLAQMALAELSARTGAPVATVTQLLGQAIKMNPDEPRPHLALVNQLLGAGEVKAALAAAQAATTALPDNTELLDALGRAQLANGEGLQAVSTFRRLVGMQPTRVVHHLRMAEALASGKNFDEATRSLRRVLELQPGLLVAQQALVASTIAAGRPQEALLVARDVQAARPTEAIGYMLAGDVDFERNAWDAAIASYRTALQKDTSNTASALKLHQALLRSGKQPEAERFAQDWQKTRLKDADFRYYLGDYALSRNDLATAEGHYRGVLAIDPKNPLAMNNVAWLMAKQGKPGAVAIATQAAVISPNNAQFLDTLATAQAAEGQLSEAIESQKRALSLAPADPSMKLNLARLYVQAGEKPLARAELAALAALGERFQGQSEVTALMQKLQ